MKPHLSEAAIGGGMRWKAANDRAEMCMRHLGESWSVVRMGDWFTAMPTLVAESIGAEIRLTYDPKPEPLAIDTDDSEQQAACLCHFMGGLTLGLCLGVALGVALTCWLFTGRPWR